MNDHLADRDQQPVSQQTPPPWPIPQQTRPIWSDPFPQQSPPTPPAWQKVQQPTPPPWPQPVVSQAAPQWPQPVQTRKKNVALIVSAVVLFVAAALSGTLYVLADRDHDAAVAELADHRADLTEAREQVDSTGDEVTAAKEENSALSDENTELQACVDAVQHYLWDGLVDPERSAALNRMFTLCQ